METTTQSAAEEVSCILSSPALNRHFTLPASANHGELNISYADIGKQPETPGGDSTMPTLLFVPGMFGTRFSLVILDLVAKKRGWRIIVVDRPGLGLSTDVAIEHRIPVWIELVPLLLAHLQIKHVTLASHSAGTLYLLNTLYQLREILDPTKPMVFMLAPWVDVAHSRMKTMRILQMIPEMAFGIWNRIPQFFNSNVEPMFAASGAIATKLTESLSLNRNKNSSTGAIALEQTRSYLESEYGISKAVQVELEKQVIKKIFSEQTGGANSEALQCLKKGPEGLWRECEDLSSFITRLADKERSLKHASSSALLQVTALFAEDDALSGKIGQDYVEKCWNGEGDAYSDAFGFEAVTVPGTSHDSLMLKLDVWEKIMRQS